MKIHNDLSAALERLTAPGISMLLDQDQSWSLPPFLDRSGARMSEGRQYEALKAHGVVDFEAWHGERLSAGVVDGLQLAKVG